MQRLWRMERPCDFSGFEPDGGASGSSQKWQLPETREEAAHRKKPHPITQVWARIGIITPIVNGDVLRCHRGLFFHQW